MAELLNDNELNLSKEVDVRKHKIKTIKSMGINPYAEKFVETHSIKKALLLKDDDQVSVAGRIVFKRTFGKFMFVQISDVFGKLQVSLSVNELNEKDYEFFTNFVDMGDYVGFSGVMYHTKTNELTVKAHSYKLLSKAMLPLPDKYHGLTDIELRYRQRYLDLIVNPEVKEVFVKRSQTINFIRNYLVKHDFMEVETPVLQTVASGAAARPFVTKHNALDKTLFLRIAPELFLKQVVAGGFPRVFEIGKNYRNEGMDAQHLQEFTMLEWYASYWNFEDNIEFVTDLLKSIVKEITGSEKITYQGVDIDFGGEWPRVNYVERLNEVLGVDVLSYDDVEPLKKHVKTLKLFNNEEIEDLVSLGALFDYVYKRKIRPGIIQPAIVFNYPNLVPLARPSDQNSKITEMFQVLVYGTELVKSYSELVDPIVQREGFEEQMKFKAQGDEEAFSIDEDFMLAMEHGMPPMSGLGLGIDRLVAIITNQEALRDVVLFPTMR